MAELLLELLSEEIPARLQSDAREQLAALLQAVLKDAGLPPAAIETFATPRRLGLVARDIPIATEARDEERRGPRVEAPAAAYEGFLRGLGEAAYEIGQRDDKKGRVWIATIRHPGRQVRDILASSLPEALARFPWPKSMRWGDGDLRWVRPLQSILCLLDGEVVPFRLGAIEGGKATAGHRFMAPERLSVGGYDDYRERLRAAKVILDASERRSIIETRAQELAAGEGLRLRSDPALLDEVAGLVEWPVPLLGRIDSSFMELPPEVLVTTMRVNQKYLALETPDGKLADRFVLVANIEADDGGAAIVAGNERVLRARLWDARFFWEQDRKRPLEAGLPKLDRMVFHAELGMLGERVERLVALTGALVPFVPGADRALAERAALLAKADLVSGMVGEFPELQGIMGGHYARAQGEPEEVAAAIAEHYGPKGPDDTCPRAPASVAVALADKLDALVGFFAKDIRPTGSKDPFALRRAALGVLRLVLENGLRLPLRAAFAASIEGYGERLAGLDRQSVADDLLAFFADRLKVHLRGEGVRHDLIAATFAVGGDDDLVRLVARVKALQAFLAGEDGRNLLAGYRRASSIVGIEEKKDKRRYAGAPDPDLLVEPAERELHAALERAEGRIAAALQGEDFALAMAALAALRGPIDAFFDKVMVNVPETDLRQNRLLLLSRIRSALDAVADFSLIEEPGRAGM